MMRYCWTGFLMWLSLAVAVPAEEAPPKKIVFLVGEAQLRSEESMPMLARILRRDYGYSIKICFSLNYRGHIDPENASMLHGIDALDDADLVIMYIQKRNLAPTHMAHFEKYVEAGKPVVGFRTALQAWHYLGAENPLKKWNEAEPARIFGHAWIGDHGNAGDAPRSRLVPVKGLDHPVLRGVKPFACPSWLVIADPEQLEAAGATVLARGESLTTIRDRQIARTTPAAWVREYENSSGKKGRVFYTSIGHPNDFKIAACRKLSLNGILWAIGDEARIPAEGAKTELEGWYRPYGIGFGREHYKRGLRPRLLWDDTK